MLEVLRNIVQEVSSSVDLDDALAVIVTRVKTALELDVCSVYLCEPESGDFVLRATDGLRVEAVDQVRLHPGDGLVGLVVERQEPVNVSDAATHPRYRYFPESGEERCKSFLGVPLIHYRRSLGVVVAQRSEERPFGEDEIAFLVTIAAQLAAAISQVATIEGVDTLLQGGPSGTGFVQGIAASRGVAIGRVVVIADATDLGSELEETAGDAEDEEKRLRQAIGRVQAEMRERAARLGDSVSDSERVLFDVYVMMLGDPALSSAMVSELKKGKSAPTAVRKTITAHAAMIDRIDDPYLSARAQDVRELGRRILLELNPQASGPMEYPENTVLIGDEISIADIADVPPGRLAAIASTAGAAFSHSAVLARALGVPGVVALGNLPLERLHGRTILVDGYEGRIYIEPTAAVRTEFRRLLHKETRLSAELEELRQLSAITSDGVSISVHVNTGLLSDITPSLESGAEGVGLYRTEFPFMIRNTFPGEEEQVTIYGKVLTAFTPRPVVMRTLDIGGDKQPSYFSIQESNPFLGWRGIRVTLDHPDIFVTQLRAMLRANENSGNLRIMFPMVSTGREVDDACTLLDRAVAELIEEGHAVERPLVGVMIEVPSAVYEVGKLARRVDFMSIGSNDLTQYLLAVDRTNARVSSLYDSVHPAVLCAIRSALRGARSAGVPISVCGDIAADPVGLLLLVGMGFDTVSMAAAFVIRAKWLIRTVSQKRAARVLTAALKCDDGQGVREIARRALQRAGLDELLGQT